MSQVALQKCPDYSPERVEGAVREAVALLGGMERFVSPGERILVKPNLLTVAAPDRAITTHPAVVKAVLRLVKEAGATPVVGDCPGFERMPDLDRYRLVCRETGVAQVCAEEGVEILHLNAETVEAKNPAGRAFKRFPVAAELLRVDGVISLPKLKTHSLTLLTGAVKNLFGCVTVLNKARFHVRAQGVENFSRMLVDLMLLVRPRLTVMDAVVGMEGDGPSNGDPRPVGAILAGEDPVAVDAVASALVGMDPLEVPTTRIAHRDGVGVGDLASITVLGTPLDDFEPVEFRLPSAPSLDIRMQGLIRPLKRYVLARPTVDTERCKSCWTCVEHCPTGAMTRGKQFPRYEVGKCIFCYCCQEMCPHDAIELRKPLLAKLLPF